MTDINNMEVCYLLAFPDTRQSTSKPKEQISGLKDAPFFQAKRRPRPTRGLIRQIAEHRLEVMLDFERVEQNLLLIGDWYTAKLYEIIQDEFYLKDWKDNVRNKLDNLENIVETIHENFNLSFKALMDRLQLIGWVLLLIGYLYLYFLDAGWITINTP